MIKRLTEKQLAEGAHTLAERDTDLARLLKTDGVPPLWAREPGFSTLILIILEQQVSLASARATYQRLTDQLVPFTPGRFLEVGPSHLRSLGITRQKAGYCINVAEAILEERLNLKALSRMDDAAVLEKLTRIKGIGPWTANIYLLMVLRRPDIWPAGDIALMTAVQEVKKLPARPASETLAEIAEGWRPFRSVAARMLWQYYLSVKAPKTENTF
ncbi:DNA-3-methyladenine glycosylase 2 family protein [bacterium]|nr:DNA-3-methyladenine glycosylase 2 family protein [bacterium]